VNRVAEEEEEEEDVEAGQPEVPVRHLKPVSNPPTAQ
jgi:hypothetical protein